MNKQDIIKAVLEASNGKLSKTEAAKAVNAVFDSIKKAIRQKKEVRVIKFGSFKTRYVRGKVVRSPRGGQVQVPDSHRVKFSASKDLKEAANS